MDAHFKTNCRAIVRFHIIRYKNWGAKFNTLGVIAGLQQHFSLVLNILVLLGVTFNTHQCLVTLIGAHINTSGVKVTPHGVVI